MASKLIDDLTHIPNIIGGLGLSIAEAQSHFDLAYLQSLERMIVLAQSMLGGKKTAEAPNPSTTPSTPGAATPAPTTTDLSTTEKEKLELFQTVIKEFLVALAPTRYQFTETTLSVKLDLAQSLDVAVAGGISAGIGGVAVNASLSVGYGYDYRAAAECKTTIHAVPTDPTTLRTMLDRAKEIGSKDLTLPERSSVDKAVQDQAGSVFEKLVGTKPAAISTDK